MTTGDVLPGRRYQCFVDICTDVVQFCYHKQRRCRYCSDFSQDCFTNVQQQNCTTYCMELWVEQQRQETSDNDCSTLTAVAVIGWILFFVSLVINLDTVVFKNKARNWLTKKLCCNTQQNTADTGPTPCQTGSQQQNSPRVSSIEEERDIGDGTTESLLAPSSRFPPNGGPEYMDSQILNTTTPDSLSHGIPQNNDNEIQASVYGNGQVSQAIPHNIDGVPSQSQSNGMVPSENIDSPNIAVIPPNMAANGGQDMARQELQLSQYGSHDPNALPYGVNTTDTGYQTGGTAFDTTYRKQPHATENDARSCTNLKQVIDKADCNNVQTGPKEKRNGGEPGSLNVSSLKST